MPSALLCPCPARSLASDCLHVIIHYGQDTAAARAQLANSPTSTPPYDFSVSPDLPFVRGSLLKRNMASADNIFFYNQVRADL